MRARVHRLIPTATITLLLLFPATLLRAQTPPIRLSVSKVQKYANADHQYSYSGGWGETVTSKTQPSTVCYNIKIQYMGAKPMKTVRVAWKMFVQQPNVANPSVDQGEKIVDLQLGKNVEFQTDLENGKAIGYIVELSTNDQVVASSVEPADIKARIDKAKAQ